MSSKSPGLEPWTLDMMRQVFYHYATTADLVN
jgi:hypothetical protein